MFCKGIIGYQGHWHTPNKKQTDGVLVKGIGIILGCRREWQSGSKVFRVQHKTGETVRVDTDSLCTGWDQLFANSSSAHSASERRAALI